MAISFFKKQPCLQFLLGFLIVTIYIPVIIGSTIPTGWLLLIIVGSLFINSISFFICYAALSLLWTFNLNIGIFFLLQMIALLGIYNLGQNLELKNIFIGLSIGLIASDVVALFYQSYVFSIDHAQAGLFVNPNIFSEVSAVILIGLLILKLWWLVPFTLPGLILVPSKSAIVALTVCGVIWTWKKNKLCIVIELLIIGLLIYLFIDKINFNFASTQQRINLWVDTIRGFSLFGNGVGSYEIIYPLNAVNIDTSIARPKYAHNDLLQLIFEFGIGIIFLIPVAWNCFISNKNEKIILYAVCIISLFTYPFHVPAMAFIGCFVSGYIVECNGSVWNTWYSWRSILFKRT